MDAVIQQTGRSVVVIMTTPEFPVSRWPRIRSMTGSLPRYNFPIGGEADGDVSRALK